MAKRNRQLQDLNLCGRTQQIARNPTGVGGIRVCRLNHSAKPECYVRLGLRGCSREGSRTVCVHFKVKFAVDEIITWFDFCDIPFLRYVDLHVTARAWLLEAHGEFMPGRILRLKLNDALPQILDLLGLKYVLSSWADHFPKTTTRTKQEILRVRYGEPGPKRINQGTSR
jgi:hypothetical protein